jgi:hypothetical protein
MTNSKLDLRKATIARLEPGLLGDPIGPKIGAGIDWHSRFQPAFTWRDGIAVL